MLQNVNISDEHLFQLDSEAIVNNSERNEKLTQHEKDLKVSKTESDENQDNPLLMELRKIQFEHSNQLAAFRSEVLEIKQTLPRRTFHRCPNCTVTKSKCIHCFVCGSDDHKKSVCPHKDSKN